MVGILHRRYVRLVSERFKIKNKTYSLANLPEAFGPGPPTMFLLRTSSGDDGVNTLGPLGALAHEMGSGEFTTTATLRSPLAPSHGACGRLWHMVAGYESIVNL